MDGARLGLSRDNEFEERLLIEAAQKDPGRFAELYENNFHRVYAYIARRVHDRSEAQDLTSHVFHQALANLGKFKWRGAPFVTWLFCIARDSVADRAQRLLWGSGGGGSRQSLDPGSEIGGGRGFEQG